MGVGLCGMFMLGGLGRFYDIPRPRILLGSEPWGMFGSGAPIIEIGTQGGGTGGTTS